MVGLDSVRQIVPMRAGHLLAKVSPAADAKSGGRDTIIRAQTTCPDGVVVELVEIDSIGGVAGAHAGVDDVRVRPERQGGDRVVLSHVRVLGHIRILSGTL